MLVEFLVALMPLMITFSSSVQLAQLATAQLVLKHSAVVGARAAAVFSNAQSNTPQGKASDNIDPIKYGVINALGPWVQTMSTVDVTVDDQSSCDDPYGMVTVKVNAKYKCSVPFGGRLVCSGGKHAFTVQSAYPHQGARYTDLGGVQCR